MRGEAVPQRVRAHLGIQAGPAGIFLDENPKHLARESLPPAAHKHPGRVRDGADESWPRFLQIALERLERRLAQGHHALLAPLPTHLQNPESRCKSASLRPT